MKKIIISLTLALLVSGVNAQRPVYDLVERICKGSSKLFLFELTDQESENDFFELDQKGGKVWIKGNNNISIATGLNWYLKYHAGVHISWNNPTTYLDKLPKVKTPERKSTDILIRYYLNYETYSGTMAFWDWKRWEQEIDFMALHGINTPLALTGATVAWRNTLIKLGYTRDEASAFIAGPAYQAWFLRGRIEGFEGPCPDSYFENRQQLEQQIIERYSEWGIDPVFAGFNGMMPKNASEKLGVKTIPCGTWNGYERAAQLDYSDPGFMDIAKTYYNELTALYGQAKYYACDPFLDVENNAKIDISALGSTIYNAMKLTNPEAIWILQNREEKPKLDIISAIPPSKTLILDISSDSRREWMKESEGVQNYKAFNRHDWIFGIMLNKGGNSAMYGRIQQLIDCFYAAKGASFGSNMKGIGATSENIENNPAMYELLYELPWIDHKIDKDKWLKTWAVARYGRSMPEIDQAWQILSNTVYNPPVDYDSNGTESVICSRPALIVDKVTDSGSSKMYYTEDEFFKAFTLMLKVSDKFPYSDNFKYDLMDIARQAIANRANTMLPKLLEAFDKGDKPEFERLSIIFLDMILLQDRLMGCRMETMVGTWLDMAMNMGTSPEQEAFYEENARRAIATWNTRNSVSKSAMRDYGHREWNGLLRDYYHPRWKYFFDQINQSGVIPFAYDYFDMEQNWIYNRTPYSYKPLSETVAMANEVYFFLNRHKIN